MNDFKLEQRKEVFQKNRTNILETRQNYKLSLRKERIDDFIMKKREKALEQIQDRSKLEINPENLNLPSDMLNKTFSSFEDFMNYVIFLLTNNNINYIKFGVLHVRKQLALEVNPITYSELMQTGILPILMNVLDNNIDNDNIVYEILWCFTNLTAGKLVPEATNFLISPKTFRMFDRILKSGKSELMYNLIWLITHIASDNEYTRESILNSSIFSYILDILEQKTPLDINILKHSIWLLSSISKGGDIDNFTILERTIKILCIYIRFDDNEVMGDSIWGLSNFSNTRYTQFIKILIDMGVVPIILNCNNHLKSSSLEAPLRLIGNILTGDDYVIDEMLKYGVIQFLENYLKSDHSILKREACWSLSNIAAGTKNQIMSLINSGVLPKVFELVKDNNHDVVREAIWVVSNCLTGSDLDMCLKLSAQGILNPILYVLVNYNEPSIISITLEGLKQLFTHGEVFRQFSNNINPFVERFSNEGGIEFLEKLQHHKNTEVYNSSSNILQIYFNAE